MKKVMLSCILVIMCVVMSACSSSPSCSEVAEEYVNAIKTKDFEKADALSASGDFQKDMMDSIKSIFEDAGDSEADEESAKAFIDKLTDFDYTLGEEKVDGDHASVPVTFKTYDFSKMMGNYMEKAIAKAFEVAFSGASEEEIDAMMNEILTTEISSLTEKSVEKESALILVKDGNAWKVADDEKNEEFTDAMLGGFLSIVKSFENLGDNSSDETDASTETEAITTEAAESVEATAAEADSSYYFRDMEIVTSDYTMKITDWKIIDPGKKGNEYGDKPVIAFWYDTTNTSGKEIDPMSAWIYIMTAVQDNDPNAINELNAASLPDDRYLDSQMATIKAGGTVSSAAAYELTDKETPVELSARNDMFGDAIGSMTFDIVTGKASNGSTASIGTIENAEKAEPSFKNNVIVTSDYTIEILDYKVIAAGKKGNEYGDEPVIAFWYNTTNTSGKEIDPMSAWIYTVTAVQDNDPNMVNELESASLPDDRFLDSQMASIKAGGTVENAVAYTLTDTETPVELTATDGLFGTELGSQVFELK